jgi:hypothetical protein
MKQEEVLHSTGKGGQDCGDGRGNGKEGASHPLMQRKWTMAIGLNSTKTPARPSHEAIESDADATTAGKSKQQKLDKTAMESAKRAQNRIHDQEQKSPVEKMFTK